MCTHINQRIYVYMNGRFVSYYRVSTVKQGVSGLGLEAQREAVHAYLNGGQWVLLGEYTEVESGKRKLRPQLEEALKMCKKVKATLIIAKLDRLARNLHFISGLMESGVDFVAVDNPTANRLTLHILAAVAEDEGRRISDRTKAALSQAKQRGRLLGKHGTVLGAINKDNADKFAESMRSIVEEFFAAGIKSVRAVTLELNKHQYPSLNGKIWHPTSVQRLLKRLKINR